MDEPQALTEKKGLLQNATGSYRLSKNLFVGAGASTARSELLRICRKQIENDAFYCRGVEGAAPYNSNFGLF